MQENEIILFVDVLPIKDVARLFPEVKHLSRRRGGTFQNETLFENLSGADKYSIYLPYQQPYFQYLLSVCFSLIVENFLLSFLISVLQEF